MPIRGVLFDFAGTLFRLEDEQTWLDTAINEAGVGLDAATRASLLHGMTAPAVEYDRLPERLREVWHRRDLDPRLHHEIYLGLLEAYDVHGELGERIYRQLVSPDNWFPYPDTADVLRRLRDAGTAVGVVSNIAWDIRKAFARYQLDGLVHSFVLSYEFGAMKPDPRIFEHACAQLGVPPAEVLMVGDSAAADGGARAVGSAFAQVEPLPTTQRPSALLDALRSREPFQLL